MSDPTEEPSNLSYVETASDPADIASAGRSCSVILILGAAILILVCVGIAARWYILN